RGIAREVAAKDGEAREDTPLVVREEPPRLIERSAEAAVPFRDVLHRRLQKAEVPLDLVCDLAAREGRSPGRRELDTERHPVHEAAHALDVRALVVGERVSAVYLTRTINEQAHCGAVTRVP